MFEHRFAQRVNVGDFRWNGHLKNFVLADNQAYGGEHRAGYNGVSELHHRADERSLFVPAYAGLNFEHIFSGDAASYDRDKFEPRLSDIEVIHIENDEKTQLILQYQLQARLATSSNPSWVSYLIRMDPSGRITVRR